MSVVKRGAAVLLLMLAAGCAASMLGCAAAGRDQKGVDLSPQIAALEDVAADLNCAMEAALTLTSDTTATGDGDAVTGAKVSIDGGTVGLVAAIAAFAGWQLPGGSRARRKLLGKAGAA